MHRITKIICEMKHLELEKELTAKIRKRRLIEGGITLLFIVIGIVFCVLYEQSRVVETIKGEGILAGLMNYQSVTYNENLKLGIAFGFAGAFIPASFLLGDFLYSKFETVEVCGTYITLYRSMNKNYLYENGECIASGAGYYLETKLSDKIRVTVSFGKWSAHMTFSNGHPPIDIY